VVPNLTFDTGALIAWEGNRANINKIVALATELERRIYVPQVVLAEWWRGYSKRRGQILRSVTIDPVTTHQAKAAGEALAQLGMATCAELTIDALVMASAATRGDIVYTSDQNDLLLLQNHFKGVRRVYPV